MSFKHLNIKTPCSQPLENISDGAGGKFCPTCNHVVHDFSELSTPELVELLQSKKYSCGIFDKQQLGTLYYFEDGAQSKRKKYWSGIAASIVAGTLQLTSAYSQNPVKTNKLQPRSMAFEKYHTEKSSVVVDSIPQHSKKETFEFQVLDEKTKKPLQYTLVEIMGKTGSTDKDGKVSFDFDYQEDTILSFVVHLSLYQYKDEKIRLSLYACYKKLTVLYMRREKDNKNREVVYGFY